MKKQDYSLNPGRYVGVVIEEDGKTEEEFIEEILTQRDEMERMTKSADSLQKTITGNLSVLAGES